jgi:hypothetical protein
MTADLRSGLEAIKGNLINFVFAALILGLTCSRGYSQHNSSFRGMATSILHEGMPMIIYSQILLWGQSTCCLAGFCALQYLWPSSGHELFPAMIPLAIEAGGDVIVSSAYSSFWSQTGLPTLPYPTLSLLSLTPDPNNSGGGGGVAGAGGGVRLRGAALQLQALLRGQGLAREGLLERCQRQWRVLFGQRGSLLLAVAGNGTSRSVPKVPPPLPLPPAHLFDVESHTSLFVE